MNYLRSKEFSKGSTLTGLSIAAMSLTSCGIELPVIAKHESITVQEAKIDCSDPNAEPLNLEQREQTLIDLHNKYRIEKGIGELAVDKELQQASKQYAIEMAINDELKHADFMSAGINKDWEKLGENVGISGTSLGPACLFVELIESPTHRDNIENNVFKSIGVGAATEINGDRVYYTLRYADFEETAQE